MPLPIRDKIVLETFSPQPCHSPRSIRSVSRFSSSPTPHRRSPTTLFIPRSFRWPPRFASMLLVLQANILKTIVGQNINATSNPYINCHLTASTYTCKSHVIKFLWYEDESPLLGILGSAPVRCQAINDAIWISWRGVLRWENKIYTGNLRSINFPN